MAASSDFKNMSLEELKAQAHEMLELVREREELERAQRDQRRKELEAEREELLLRLEVINEEILELGGNELVSQYDRAGSQGSPSMVDAFVEFVGERGRATTDEVRQYLQEEGFNTENIGQIANYLKKQGRLVGVARGVYQLPETDRS